MAKQRYTLNRLRWVFRAEDGYETHEAKGLLGTFIVSRYRQLEDGEWSPWQWSWRFRSYHEEYQTVESVKDGINKCNELHKHKMLEHLTAVPNPR